MFVASADVAQSVEHLIGNEEVGSSNLLISSKTIIFSIKKALQRFFDLRFIHSTNNPICLAGEYL